MEPIILTPKQQKFCDEYLIDMNATKAALRAGYSAGTALNGQLMQIPKIRYYLQQRTEEVSRKTQISHEQVLAELGKIAFANMRNYYHSDGRLKGAHELTDDEAAALWCMKVTDGKDGQSSFIRLASKLSALEKIARHLRFYEPEEQQPEKVFVYLDPKTLDNYDTFDDELFNRLDYENAYYDADHKDYYHWDTECKVAVAQARAACRLRRAEVVSPEPGVDSHELGSEEEEVAVAGEKVGSLEPGAGSLEQEAFFESPTDGALPMTEGPAAATGGERAGGVIDFGSGKKGSCKVPLMMGNSREYRYD
ncbi:terminase small subunit [Mucilaginibacter sp. PPCGB 2223]|uniref:terminase small subunit n=1 Tax=Mucilaginibacter sp. PPCGB 2223 TaxID=1886027 RepID=UPI001585D698|nr:terminase small subunit [Mucilaginibacter sp. PPCGB 2223]